MAYLRRIVDDELDELVAELPAIAIEGPRGVGKTETASRHAATVHRLDGDAQRLTAAADPWRLANGKRPILIDEWQRLPETWDVVRRAVDEDGQPGQFLLTGSAAPIRPPAHSGAGRIVSLRMRPMTLPERSGVAPSVSLRDLLSGRRPRVEGRSNMRLDDYAHEIIASGFPGLRDLGDRALRLRLDSYLRHVVDRDLPDTGRDVRSPDRLLQWIGAYAAATATTSSLEAIRDAATPGEAGKPARATVDRYLDALRRVWLADPLPAWSPSRNLLARLNMSPKHHLADPALAARVLGLGVGALLDGRDPGPSVPRAMPMVGSLFESLMTMSVRVFAQAAEARVGHFRTRNGDHEVDLIVERDDRRVVAIETKLSGSVDDADVRHLRWLADRLGPDLLDAAVVTTGQEAYRRRDGIAVVPAALLGP